MQCQCHMFGLGMKTQDTDVTYYIVTVITCDRLFRGTPLNYIVTLYSLPKIKQLPFQ